MAADPRWNRRSIVIACAVFVLTVLAIGFLDDLFSGLALMHGHQPWLVYVGSLLLMGLGEILSEGIGEFLFHPKVLPWILLGGVIATALFVASSVARLELR